MVNSQQYNDSAITVTAVAGFQSIKAVFDPYYMFHLTVPPESTLVRIDPSPDGNAKNYKSNGKTDSTYDLKYLPTRPEWNILVTVTVLGPWHVFNGWSWYNLRSDTSTTVHLDSETISQTLTPQVIKKQFALQVQLWGNGSITVNPSPNGGAQTFDQSNGKSIDLMYNALDTVRVTANPVTAFKLASWNDSAGTTTPSIKVTMKKNIELSPMFVPITNEFKVPIYTTASDNMRVEGLTRLTNKVECYNPMTIYGTLKVKDKNGGSNECDISNKSIALGNTFIGPDSLRSVSMQTNLVTTDSVLYHGTLHTNRLMARRLQVKLSVFPDFVFTDQYRCENLKSIQETERFLKEHKHLENIPTAAQAKKDGMDIGALYTELVRKLEEMTLYTIQLHKQVKALEEKKK